MRRLVVLLSLALATGCAAPQGRETCPACGVGGASIQDFDQRTAALRASNPELFTGRPVGPPPTPAERQKVEADRAKREREDALLERALTNSPDYTSALRRAAVANVDAEQVTPASGRRTRSAEAQAKEQRIAAEEARLSDVVEKRRQDRLNQQAQNQKTARDQAAVSACVARGNQIDAAYYNPRSILNLEGMAAGVQARNACLEAYQRTGILP
jgi:hypothetical protein